MATVEAQATAQRLYLAGEWVDTGESFEVRSPYSGEVVGRVARAGSEHARHAIDALEGYRTTLDAHLAANGPYLLGELFTSADLFLFMLTRWGRRLERRWWDAPALGNHYRTIKARPALQHVFQQEQLDDDT